MKKGYRQMKKMIRLFLSIMLFFACSILTTGCTCTPGYAVKVTFKEIPEEFNVENYIREAEFEEDVFVEFSVPEGYDESVIKISANGVDVVYDVEYINADGVDTDYLYSVEKKISFTCKKVNKTINVLVDLSEVEKKTFEISLADKNLDDCFKVVTLKPDLKGDLLKLTADDIVQENRFISNTTEVTYGDEIALVYMQKTGVPKYESLYINAKPIYFKNAEDVKFINDIEYLQYDVSKRGNSYYRYNYDASSRIFYIGQVKEDIKFYTTIPNYVNDKKVHVGDNYNTFYLLTNMERYNSDLITLEAFVPNSNVSYSVNNPLVDRINGTVVSKISGEEYNQRYDLYNIYLGDNMNSDPLLESKDKVNMYNEIYIKIKSEVDLDDIVIRLLKAEKEYLEGGVALTANIISSKANNYIKLTKEEVASFCDQYVYEDDIGNSIPYLNGAAILYVEMKYEYITENRWYGTFDYSRIVLQLNILNEDSERYASKLHLIPYVNDSDGIDYGSIDYHYYGNDVVYIRTDKLFDDNDEPLNNLYVDIFSEDYVDYKTPIITTINIKLGEETITKEPLVVKNPKTYNGYKGHIIPLIERDQLDEYRIVIDVSFREVEQRKYEIDFSKLNLPSSLEDRIYVTNSFQITSYSDFSAITYINKDLFNDVTFSYTNELYYVINTPNISNFNFELYLDGNDRNTLVTYEGILKDIRGKVVTVVINGRQYDVKYKYMSLAYEVPENDKYTALPA